MKDVEAALVLSARLSNNKANKLKIIKYVYSKGYKVSEIKNRGFGRVELIFDNYMEANKCLADVQSGNNEKVVNFYIPRREISCKGVINWDKYASLDELLDSMVATDGITEVERMKRRRFDRESGRVREEITDLVCVTWENNRLPEQIRIYGGLSGLRMKPFIENVILCYNCYGYGHLQKHCKARKRCVICGEDFHGECRRDLKCINCGGSHRPTDKNCEKFKLNSEIKKVMAVENVNVVEARDKVLKKNNGKGLDRGKDLSPKWHDSGESSATFYAGIVKKTAIKTRSVRKESLLKISLTIKILWRS